MTTNDQGPLARGLMARGRWLLPPDACAQHGHDRVVVTAPGRTDRYVDPQTGHRRANSPLWLVPAQTPATLVAHVQVGFRAAFDAAVLVAYRAANAWAKLCFECDAGGRPMVVSVVTRSRSDDANAFTVDGDAAWLRVSLLERGIAFHASLDGKWWELVRLFSLGQQGVTRVGISVQSPVGDGCQATFAHLALRQGVVNDVRGGQ